MITTINLALAVLTLPDQDTAFGQFSQLNGHRWAMTLQIGEMREYVLSDYAFVGPKLVSKSAAHGLVLPTKWVSTTFGREADGSLTMEQLHDVGKWVGSATATQSTIVFQYGPEDKSFVLKDEFRWIDTKLAKGELYTSDGKKVGSYTMRRVEKPGASLVLDGLDPVALIGGKEVSGKPEITATYNRWSYQFVSPASRAAFLKSPAKYAVQFDGACMNMGPLSGRGGSKRFAVHKGRTFLFASDSCLAAFQKAPDDYIDKPDLPIRATQSERRAGAEWLEKAAAAHGGKALDAAKSISWENVTTYEDRGETKKYFEVSHLIGDSTFVEDAAWDDVLYRNVATPKGGWSGRIDQPYLLEASERAFLIRKFLHNPIVILKNRKNGLLAKALGTVTMPNGTNAIGVRTFKDGSATTLYLDPETHRVIGSRFKGRGRTAVHDVFESFSEWQTVSGITTATKKTAVWPGRMAAATTRYSVHVDQTADAVHWEHPLTKFP